MSNDYHEAYKLPWSKPKSEKRKVASWQLIFKVKKEVREVLKVGPYSWCVAERNRRKFDYPKNSLKIIAESFQK